MLGSFLGVLVSAAIVALACPPVPAPAAAPAVIEDKPAAVPVAEAPAPVAAPVVAPAVVAPVPAAPVESPAPTPAVGL